MIVPDAVSPAEGWRSWNTAESYGELLLVSPSQGTIWPPRQELRAHCGHSAAKRMQGCHCGINAWDSQERLEADDTYRECPVWGRVKLWGEVHTFDHGLRAQRAVPAELFVSDRVRGAEQVAARLSQAYGVPCTVARPAPQDEAERVAKLNDPDSEGNRVGAHILVMTMCAILAPIMLWGALHAFKAWGNAWQVSQERDIAGPLMGFLITLMLPGITPAVFTFDQPAWQRARTTRGQRSQRRAAMAALGVCVVCFGIGFVWLLNMPDPGEHAREATQRDGKSRTIHAPDGAPRWAWTWNYASVKDGACEVRMGDTDDPVLLCRDGGDFTFKGLDKKADG
jgi:hypothetical protein